ncbi:MAG TPA: hypothetical protein VHK28_01125 [Candidatus Limnocylindria bacterium]|nr:hypothetical protein [Candidatus Limnocylindria bacterium]
MITDDRWPAGRTPTRRRLFGPRGAALAGATALVMVLAACGEAAPPSVSPSASVTPEATPSPSEPMGGTAGANPSLPSSVPELEAVIPDQVAGMSLEKSSMRGEDFIDSQEADELTREFLRQIEVDPEDLAVAVGFGLDRDTGTGVGVLVFNAQGADPDALVRVFKETSDAERDTPLEWESVTVGGKEVERTTDPLQGDQVVHLYGHEDTLFLVSATSDEIAAEALEALP